MSKFYITTIVLIVLIIGIIFYLEVPYENNYQAVAGDEVVVDIIIYDTEGEIITSGQDQTVIAGDNNSVPFGADLIGMKLGDKATTEGEYEQTVGENEDGTVKTETVDAVWEYVVMDINKVVEEPVEETEEATEETTEEATEETTEEATEETTEEATE